jgi:HEAT repeat protein
MRIILPLCLSLLLCGCGHGKSTEMLIKDMQSRDVSVKLEAIRALASMRAEAALIVPELTKALRDENTAVRRDAAQALGNMGAEARPAIAALVPLLEDKNVRVRKVAALAIQRIDPDRTARRK